MSLLLATVLFAPPAAVALEFNGVVGDTGTTWLSLGDPATGVSRWVPVGGAFPGYVVTAYDAPSEVATLHGVGGKLLQLRLGGRKPGAGSGDVIPGGELPADTAAAIQANLRLLFAAARIHFLEGRSHYVTVADLVGTDKPIERLVPIAGEDYGALALMKGETDCLTVTTAMGAKVSLARPRFP